MTAAEIPTRMAKVAFQPPSICLLGSNPLASFCCSEECQTLLITPPGTPSNDSPTGVVAMQWSHCASEVAVADWRGILRCRVFRDRRSSHASIFPITLPKNVRSWNNCGPKSASLPALVEPAYSIPFFLCFDYENAAEQIRVSTEILCGYNNVR